MNSKHKKKKQLIQVEFTYLEASLILHAIGSVWPSKTDDVYPNGHHISIHELWEQLREPLTEVTGSSYITNGKHPQDVYIQKVKDETSNQSS